VVNIGDDPGVPYESTLTELPNDEITDLESSDVTDGVCIDDDSVGRIIDGDGSDPIVGRNVGLLTGEFIKPLIDNLASGLTRPVKLAASIIYDYFLYFYFLYFYFFYFLFYFFLIFYFIFLY